MAGNGYKTLSGDEAIAKWKLGKDEWNKWAEDNPKYNVDFSEVNFSEHVGDSGEVDFSELNFPDGYIYFNNTIFGDVDVKFLFAKFGDGDVDFSYAKFGKGSVDFFHAKFGDGDVDFSYAEFGKGNVTFWGVNFGKGESVNFTRADFGDGYVGFEDVNFGGGHANFFRAKFGKGDICFMSTKFGDGEVIFTGADFGDGEVIFERAKFKNYTRFCLKNIEKIKNFSFKYASFDGAVDILSYDKNKKFGCLIDLTHTKTTHHVSLAEVNCTLNRTPRKKPLFGIFKGDWITQQVIDDDDKADIDRARRLKELAESNKDHHKAQDFHVMEMQAKREFRDTHIFSRFSFFLKSEFWFDALSDYGRSITLPISHIVSLWLFFGIVYSLISFKFFESFTYSAAQMFSFLPTSRNVLQDHHKDLFSVQAPEWIYAITYSQNGLALILFFLLALGVRHRYRI